MFHWHLVNFAKSPGSIRHLLKRLKRLMAPCCGSQSKNVAQSLCSCTCRVKDEICWKFIITANLVAIWRCMTSVGTIFDVGFARKSWHLQRRFWNSKGQNKIGMPHVSEFGPPMSDCQIAPACKRTSKVPVSSLSHGAKGIPNWSFFGNVF